MNEGMKQGEYNTKRMFFQFFMTGLVTVRLAIFPFVGMPPDIFGVIVLTVCLYYQIKAGVYNDDLETRGPWRYSRNPIYVSALLIDSSMWWKNTHDPLFWATGVVAWAFMIGAAYYSEKERLSKFGKEAEDYFAKTPHVILWF